MQESKSTAMDSRAVPHIGKPEMGNGPDFINKYRIKKLHTAKAPGSKPRTTEYSSAKAEFKKQDGTTYHTQWSLGQPGRCDCLGYKFHDHTCKHIKFLQNSVGLGNGADDVSGE